MTLVNCVRVTAATILSIFSAAGCTEKLVDNHAAEGPAGAWISTDGHFVIAVSLDGRYFYCHQDDCQSGNAVLSRTAPQILLQSFYSLRDSESFGVASCAGKELYDSKRLTERTRDGPDLVLQLERQLSSGFVKRCGGVPCILVCNVEEGIFLRKVQ
jgi:hypothetical protein